MRRFRILALITLCGSWSVATAASPSSISPDELYARIVRNAQVPAHTGVGTFIHRTTNKPPADDVIRTQVNATIASLEKYRKEHPEDKPKETLDQIRARLIEQLNQTTTTSLETYSLSGHRFRVERRRLPNDQPLDSLKSRFSDRTTWPQIETILVGDGRSTDQLDPSSLPLQSNEERGPSRLMRTDFAMKAPAFLTYGRDASDPNLLKVIRTNSKDLPIRVIESKEEGVDILTLLLGTPGSIGFVIEFVTLPAQGYAIKRSSIKAFDQVMSQEEYDGFIQTSAGFWLPTRILRETHAIDEKGVRRLAAHEELVALEDPKVNVTLAADLFELKADNRTLVLDRRAGKAAAIPTVAVTSHELIGSSPILLSGWGRWLRVSLILLHVVILSVLWLWWRKRQVISNIGGVPHVA